MGGPQNRPKNVIILIMGTPKKVLLILGNSHIGEYRRDSKGDIRSSDYSSCGVAEAA